MDGLAQMEDRGDDPAMMTQDDVLPGVALGATLHTEVVTLDGAADAKGLALADESAVEDWLDTMREADALTFDCESDDTV